MLFTVWKPGTKSSIHLGALRGIVFPPAFKPWYCNLFGTLSRNMKSSLLSILFLGCQSAIDDTCPLDPLSRLEGYKRRYCYEVFPCLWIIFYIIWFWGLMESIYPRSHILREVCGFERIRRLRTLLGQKSLCFPLLCAYLPLLHLANPKRAVLYNFRLVYTITTTEMWSGLSGGL